MASRPVLPSDGPSNQVGFAPLSCFGLPGTEPRFDLESGFCFDGFKVPLESLLTARSLQDPTTYRTRSPSRSGRSLLPIGDARDSPPCCSRRLDHRDPDPNPE